MGCQKSSCETKRRARDEMIGCKRPVGHFTYDFAYPAKDACGGDAPKFRGAVIEVLGPGDDEYKVAAFVPYPSLTVELAVTMDGNYSVRHRINTSCTVSEPSDPVTEYVDLTPAAKPPAGQIRIPCNQ